MPSFPTIEFLGQISFRIRLWSGWQTNLPFVRLKSPCMRSFYSTSPLSFDLPQLFRDAGSTCANRCTFRQESSINA